MKEKLPKYTEEYRRECADYALASDKPVSQVAKELGINEKTLSAWVVKRRRELAGEVSVPSSVNDTERELKAAQKRIRELEQENAFLKKASAFFAKNLQ